MKAIKHSDTIRPIIGGIEIVKVVRDHAPIYGDGTATYGQCIDAQMKEAAMAGDEIQTISLHIEKEDWIAYASRVQNNEYLDHD